MGTDGVMAAGRGLMGTGVERTAETRLIFGPAG